MKKSIVFIVFIMVSMNGLAQQKVRPLSRIEKEQAINSIVSILNTEYVFPEVAQKLSKNLQENLTKTRYQSITNPNTFALLVTEDLQSISKDRHLRVFFAPDEIRVKRMVISTEDSIRYLQEKADQMSKRNFGFKEVKILDGNIGYLDLRMFYDPHFAGETAIAAMQFLNRTDAIIIDLRNNGGGEPTMIQLLSSYFFNSTPTHLNNFYWRSSDMIQQTWTLPHVPGTRMPEVDIYILIGSGTFSAAEEFAYNFKNLNRATLIGESTGGAAHAGDVKIVSEYFMIWVPNGRAISPITNSNWEGVGVEPDIKTNSQAALKCAKILALEKLLVRTGSAKEKNYLEWYLQSAKAGLNPVKMNILETESYIGTYGPRSVKVINEDLYYQRSGPEYKLIPMGGDLFMIEELADFRLKFIRENNMINALQGVYRNGDVDVSLKDMN
ncbi:S41 family peptidase [Ekhidna sp.]|uniref:S41 family peptidase n=1 Tax=Ekhidna sp. TaxID=2608089 RepID=UPI003296FED1